VEVGNMTLFESEVQKLIYGILTGDPGLLAYLGKEAADQRIYLSLNDSEVEKIGPSKPAYIVMETMPAPAPIRLAAGIDDWTERFCLHIYTRPEDRDLRAAIVGRLRELLHRKSFATERFIIYHVFEDVRESVLTDSALLDYRYTVSLRFLPKVG
jgi:hypothetical protein